MADMFRCAPETMCGAAVKDFHVSLESFEELKWRVAEALGNGQPLHHEMWMRRADGQSIWVQIDAHSACGADVRQGIWWMMQDRTEIRIAQQQLQARYEELQLINSRLAEAQNQLLQQDKMASIGQLAAGVAHEINNPIGFVSSNLNTLRQYVDGLMSLPAAYDAVLAAPADSAANSELERLRDEVELEYLREDLPQLLDECAEGLGRVKKIVQDLKDFSRVDESDWQEADLNAGLESTLNVVRHEVKYKAEVVKRLTPLPPVMCLAAQLNQVFMNLVVNAVHAISERGTITLSSGVQEGWVWVQVTDTGCGMSEEVKRRIFEPFFTTKDVGKGTGLGLSLSFSIVQKHGGVIAVQSAPGTGSSFRVWVPVGGPQSIATGAAPPAWPAEAQS
jgi:signal transduction histidine kinase